MTTVGAVSGGGGEDEPENGKHSQSLLSATLLHPAQILNCSQERIISEKHSCARAFAPERLLLVLAVLLACACGRRTRQCTRFQDVSAQHILSQRRGAEGRRGAPSRYHYHYQRWNEALDQRPLSAGLNLKDLRDTVSLRLFVTGTTLTYLLTPSDQIS